jgi:choline dehydrogenase
VLPTPFARQGLAEPSERALSVLVTAVAVAGRGSVTLRSADPNAKPLIDPAYLADKADLDILVAGVRQARQIAAIGELATMTGGERPPESGEDLADHVRRECATLVHPASTCAMGSSGGTVCDPALRVRGVDNLRVADASVMPTVPRGDPMAPTIALAERASDLVRNLN